MRRKPPARQRRFFMLGYSVGSAADTTPARGAGNKRPTPMRANFGAGLTTNLPMEGRQMATTKNTSKALKAKTVLSADIIAFPKRSALTPGQWKMLRETAAGLRQIAAD